MAEKNTKPVQGPGGRGPKGPRPKVENPGKLFMRLLAYIMKNYAVHCILVVICIFITVLASVQGTWFMQTLIDSYILPLLADALGPFGSPVSDSTRALVDERTRVCLTIIYGFDGAAPVEEALRISAAAFARFCRCRPLCDPWCVQG